jgi:hypothetical protein
MRVTWRSAWLALVAPALVAGLGHCTLDGLNALGAGYLDASTDSGPPDVDAAPGLDVAQGADVDASSPAAEAGVDAAADSDASDETSAPPATAPPIYLDAGTGSWCDSHPFYTFCADFDKTPLPAGFSASDGAYLLQTSSMPAPSSAPNDLLLLVPAQGGSSVWDSKVSRPFTTAASSITLEFDFYPELVPSSALLFVALDFLGNSNAKYSVRLAYNGGSPRFEESYLGSPPDVYHSNFSLPLKTYSHVSVQVTLPPSGDAGADAGTATETVSVNGTQQGTAEPLTPPAGFDPHPTLLVGGVYSTFPTGEWALRYDNVTLNIK